MSIRWIVIFVAFELISIAFGRGIFDTSSEHRKRHKRVIKLPFVAENLSHNPEIRRVLLSCPRQNELEPKKYLEFHELCDDIQDCPNGEDEDEHYCMFKKLEDAELQRLKASIRSVIRQRSRKPRPHYQFIHTHQEKDSEEDDDENRGTKSHVKQKILEPQDDDSYEDDDDDDDGSEDRVSDAFRVESSNRKS